MTLERKLELIHAIKCSKTDKSPIAEQSNNKLADLKGRLATEGATASLKKDMEDWMGSFPVVLERDIENIATNKI